MTSESRRLVLLRHATAEPGVPDVERHLTDAGLDEARRAGRWLKENDLLGDVVVCSPATRTRETWAAVQEETGHGVLIDMEPAVYEATVDDLLQVVHDLDASEAPARTVVLVGHAPGLPMLAHELCEGQGSSQDVEQLTRGFVPASVAVLGIEGSWADVARGSARLEAVRVGDADPTPR